MVWSDLVWSGSGSGGGAMSWGRDVRKYNRFGKARFG